MSERRHLRGKASAGSSPCHFILLSLPLDAAFGVDWRRRWRRFRFQRFRLHAEPFVIAAGRHLLDEQMGQCPNQRVDAIRRITGSRPLKVARETAHLVFQSRERTDLMDLGLFVECRDRFGANDFPASGAHSRIADIVVRHADRVLDLVEQMPTGGYYEWLRMKAESLKPKPPPTIYAKGSVERQRP